ncbi:alpha/beta hydrolase [Nocardia sp. NPDC051570]|uniref:alpha/beta hydrolase n=1 Tax=Nocardia sp. NPDC051570 TaxID=3364324 RepID=UPI0037B0A77A
MPYFEGERGRLHYRRWPVPEPAAVVELLPGTGQHSAHYHHFARALAARGIETWGLDLPGQGLSEGDPQARVAPGELASDARGLAAILRARLPEAPLVVAGHSLGAATSVLARIECAGMVFTGTPRHVTVSFPELPVRPPILALHGVDDRRAPIDPIREWAARQRSVTLLEYADTGHDLLHEPASKQVTQDIIGWILALVESGSP